MNLKLRVGGQSIKLEVFALWKKTKHQCQLLGLIFLTLLELSVI